MKKLIFILTLALLIPAATQAQTIFGITGGINLAKFSGDDAEFHEEGVHIKPGNFMGIVGGVFANMKLGENLAFRPEVLYSQKGAKYSDEIMGASYDLKMNLAYIEVPLLLQYTLSSSETFGIFLMGGGSLGFNMSAKMTGEVSGGGMTITFDEDVKEDVKSLDYGVVFGAGVVINNMIEIFARYNMGLANIMEPEDGGETLNVKNTAIEIRAGFRLSK